MAGGSCCVAFFRTPPTIDFDRLLNHELELVGSRGKRASSYRTALRLMADGQVDLESVIGAKLPLDDWERGIELVGQGVKVVLEVRPAAACRSPLLHCRSRHTSVA